MSARSRTAETNERSSSAWSHLLGVARLRRGLLSALATIALIGSTATSSHGEEPATLRAAEEDGASSKQPAQLEKKSSKLKGLGQLCKSGAECKSGRCKRQSRTRSTCA